MKIQDLFQETYLAITANKARSVLTILGIVIGIGSVIGMISIGQGASASITDSIEAGGSNILTITPGKQTFGPVQSGGSVESITNDDAGIIENLDNVEAVSPEVTTRYQINSGENNANSSVYGVQNDYFEVKELEVTSGTLITSSHVKSSSKVVVLGSQVAEDLFEDKDPLGESLKINNMNFKVIGVLESIGSGFTSSDDSVFIPLTVSQRYFIGDEYLSTISVKVSDPEYMEDVKEEITTALLKEHNLDTEEEADFNILSSQEMLEMAETITGTLTILLGAIAGISLVVGGIGIMNMMLTTVTERTKEIGLRKAIGAKAKDISNQFLMESVMLTFLGGLIGIGLGWMISWVVTTFFDMAAVVTPSSILLACGVSIAVGVIFGYYPARRAARLNPIDALRYE